jgi:hypothetical protein
MFKDMKRTIHRIIILPVILYGCETWSLTLTEKRRLRVLENRIQRKVFEIKREEITGDWRKQQNKEVKLHERELCESCCPWNVICVIKSRNRRWHVQWREVHTE